MVLIGLFSGIYLAHASQVTAVDVNDVLVTDDLNVTKEYTTAELNSFVIQSAGQKAYTDRQSQTADETLAQWSRIQQVFQNEVSTNSYNNAQSL